jgi:uncharacterized membrane protein YphA (DoxX/SURF4 family)
MLISILFMLGRVAVAAYFINAGINHFKNAGGLTQYAQSRGVRSGAKALTIISGVVLVLGGLGVLLGLAERLALLALTIFLVVVSFSIHHFWTDPAGNERAGQQRDFMKNLVLAAALLMTLAIPIPWTWSLF